AALAGGGSLVPLPIIPLNISEFNKENISVYPNPVSSELNIKIASPFDSFSATVYDMSGRPVVSSDHYTGTINTSMLSDGFYMLKLTIDNKDFTQKIIVNK
ncbi:MAG TPA: T9SS type A sorting domain-containing protein, partial [Flavobacterium sp.]|nr:T9SS type A sorting domain-containing protein [Flavobacterium sp.]